MAGARANWKGFLTIGEIACPVALYTAASTSERIAFHMINRKPATASIASSSIPRRGRRWTGPTR